MYRYMFYHPDLASILHFVSMLIMYLTCLFLSVRFFYIYVQLQIQRVVKELDTPSTRQYLHKVCEHVIQYTVYQENVAVEINAKFNAQKMNN